MREEFTQSTDGCARCGQRHDSLIFHTFSGSENPFYTHWATCPRTGEPILLRTVVVEEDVTDKEIRQYAAEQMSETKSLPMG